jgi:dUTP pyrophosphatase
MFNLFRKPEVEIKIKYFDKSLPRIKKIKEGDWIDLRAARSFHIGNGGYVRIPLGVGMILPDGYEAHVLPRSSTPERFGIVCANSMGIIDNSYSGDADEWHFPALAIRESIIEKGDRIAQFRIVKSQPKITFKVVSRLNEKSRGGFGSTGNN